MLVRCLIDILWRQFSCFAHCFASFQSFSEKIQVDANVWLNLLHSTFCCINYCGGTLQSPFATKMSKSLAKRKSLNIKSILQCIVSPPPKKHNFFC